MAKTVFFLTLLILTKMTLAQDFTLPLYPSGKLPNRQKSEEKEKRESNDILWITAVQTPDIAVYLPTKRYATGAAVVICPGGGYAGLAYDLEGTDIAKWLNTKGIAAIVLKYRLPLSKNNITPHLTPLLDAKRALRLVRANAAKWNIKKDQIGIMGFSAGGHLASTLLTHFDSGSPAAQDSVDQQSSRPDFGVLVYPVVSMSKPIMHAGSRNNLIGEKPDPSLATLYSNELQVTRETPPTFLVHAMDDEAVPVENSLLFFQSLKDHGVSGELHVFPKGGHGFGLGIGKGAVESWPALCTDWINSLSK
jgi:acetyl esterase/lipase